MNRGEWDVYTQAQVAEPYICGDDFERPGLSSPDRLLCRGYHPNGGPNVRIWLDWRGRIGRQFNDDEVVWKKKWETEALRPSKRAYREDTDLRFALLMRERNEYPLSFTTWQSEG